MDIRANTVPVRYIVKICVCVGQCDIAGTEIPQHRNADRVDAGHHEDGTYCQHEETVGEDPLGGLFIALSHLHAHKRGTADSHEKRDGADHSDYRTADTGPRQWPWSPDPGIFPIYMRSTIL